MAFNKDTFIPLSAMANSSAPRIFSYVDTGTLASTKAANYFDAAADPTKFLGLRNGDVILVTGSDATSFLKMAVSAANVVTTASANDFA